MIKIRVCKIAFPFIFICSVLFSETLQCQAFENIDSLQNILLDENNDTNRVKLILQISKELRKTDPQSAIIYYQDAYSLSAKNNFLPGIIDALSEQSRIYVDLGNYDSAQILCEKAIFLSDSISDLVRLADCYYKYGVVLYRTEGPIPANNYFIKSYNLFYQIEDSLGIANSLNGIGVTFMNQAKYDSAIFYYLKLINISELNGYENILGKGYINIGLAYDELDEYDKATYYFWESIDINTKLNNQIFLGQSYNNLGNIKYENDDIDSAKILYQKSLDIHKTVKYKLGIANAYIGLGNVFEKENRYDKAYQYYQLAKNSYTSLGNKEGFLIAYKNQGLIQEKWGNYDKSIAIYDSCLMIAKEVGLSERKEELFFNMYNSYWLKEDFENAFKYLLDYHYLSDSIINLKKTEVIANLQLKYEKEKDQALIYSLENENLAKDLSLRKRTNQRNIYLFTGLGIIAIVLFLLIFYRYKARKDRIISEQRILQLEEEKKLLAARSIVDGQEEERKRIAKELHDGLGVLLSTAKMQFTSIKDKSPENRPLIDKATKLLEQAAGDVRKISHNMMPGLLTKFGLYEATEDLIEQLDETEGLSATCEVIGDTKRLSENTEIMLYRIIQEMVNNTLKHAEAKNIRLHMNKLAEQLNITYSDDGKGFNMEEKLESKSIGLTSIQSRVNFLSGQINIESKPGEGMKYNMQIPV